MSENKIKRDYVLTKENSDIPGPDDVNVVSDHNIELNTDKTYYTSYKGTIGCLSFAFVGFFLTLIFSSLDNFGWMTLLFVATCLLLLWGYFRNYATFTVSKEGIVITKAIRLKTEKVISWDKIEKIDSYAFDNTGLTGIESSTLTYSKGNVPVLQRGGTTMVHHIMSNLGGSRKPYIKFWLTNGDTRTFNMVVEAPNKLLEIIDFFLKDYYKSLR